MYVGKLSSITKKPKMKIKHTIKKSTYHPIGLLHQPVRVFKEDLMHLNRN